MNTPQTQNAVAQTVPEYTQSQLEAIAEWGAGFLANEDWERAAHVFDTLRVMKPSYYPARAGLAAVAMLREKWSAAELLLLQALALPDGDRDATVAANLDIVRRHLGAQRAAARREVPVALAA